jgi:hypothetical protein
MGSINTDSTTINFNGANIKIATSGKGLIFADGTTLSSNTEIGGGGGTANLAQVVNLGNATSNTMILENTDKTIVSSGNIESNIITTIIRFQEGSELPDGQGITLENAANNGNTISNVVQFSNGFTVGSNLVVDEIGTNVIDVTGRIGATLFVGDGGLLSNISGGGGGSADLQDVTENGNTTSEIVQFTNGLVASSISGLDTLSFTSTNTTTPPLQLTASSLNDGVGALRIDSVEPDIYLNDTNGGFATVTFADNDVQRCAFGRNSGNDFYLTVRDPSTNSGNWRNDTFVADSSTGDISMGYGLTVSGNVLVTSTVASEIMLEADSGDTVETNNPIFKLRQDGRGIGADFGIDQYNSPYINFNATGASSSSANSFHINYIDSANTYLTVSKTGNVGIGTTSPVSQLHIEDGNFRTIQNIYINAAALNGTYYHKICTLHAQTAHVQLSGIFSFANPAEGNSIFNLKFSCRNGVLYPVGAIYGKIASGRVNLLVYKNADNTHTVYIKTVRYSFCTFEVKTTNTITIDYDGTSTTSTPSGTSAFVASTIGSGGVIYVDSSGNMTIPGTYSPFTGTHVPVDDQKYAEFEPGTTLVSTGTVKDPSVLTSTSFNVQNSATPMDTRVIGVAVEEDDELRIVAVGEGQMLVCPENGDIQNGDYICSSSEPYGMKQPDDLMHSYTIAKATEDCIFQDGETKKLISVVFHCG